MCIFFCFIHVQSISRKNLVLPIEKFPSLVLPRNVIILQHLMRSGRNQRFNCIVKFASARVNLKSLNLSLFWQLMMYRLQSQISLKLK